jgi:hypothetical protein
MESCFRPVSRSPRRDAVLTTLRQGRNAKGATMNRNFDTLEKPHVRAAQAMDFTLERDCFSGEQGAQCLDIFAHDRDRLDRFLSGLA